MLAGPAVMSRLGWGKVHFQTHSLGCRRTYSSWAGGLRTAFVSCHMGLSIGQLTPRQLASSEPASEKNQRGMQGQEEGHHLYPNLGHSVSTIKSLSPAHIQEEEISQGVAAKK